MSSEKQIEIFGLPFTCANCGISYYVLHDDREEMIYYCSGDCKWCVLLCQESSQEEERRGGSCTTDEDSL